MSPGDLTAALEAITSQSARHRKFLSDLGHMEAQGHQMLLRYQRATGSRDKFLFQHIGEEARHAQILRSAAAALYPGRLPPPGQQARNYLRKLELSVMRVLKESSWCLGRDACYLMVTYIVERRALKLYGAYEAVLRGLDSPFSVEVILKDESGHLDEIERKLAAIPNLANQFDRLTSLEEASFANFIESH